MRSNYVLQRTGGDIVRFNQSLRPARPLNTALGGKAEEHFMGIVFPAVPCRSFATPARPAVLRA